MSGAQGVTRRAALLGGASLAAGAGLAALAGVAPAAAQDRLPDYGGVSFGDSLTSSRNVAWPTTVLARELETDWLNGGRPGWGSRDIAILAGVPTPVSVQGGRLPAAGSVPANVPGTGGLSPFVGIYVTGRLDGYAVTLAHDRAGRWSVARMGGRGSVSVRSDAVFTSDYAGVRSNVFTIWAGRNNVGQPGWAERALQDIESIRALPNVAAAPIVLVASVTNRTDEHRGASGGARAGYDQIVELNAELERRFGDHYTDPRTHLIRSTPRRLGIQLSSGDRRLVDLDAPPTAVMDDPTHPTPSAYIDLAYACFHAKLEALGARDVIA